MLTLTQLSVGAFVITLLIDRFSGGAAGNPLVQTAFAIALAVLALAASVFHLGRPALAWRAVLGFRRSWLSREAIAFALFALFATSYGVVAALPHSGSQAGRAFFARSAPLLQNAAAFAGLLGVFCSVMVYVATRRELWSGTYTGLKFFGTTLLLGAAMVLAVGSSTSSYTPSSDQVSRSLVFLVFAVNAIKVVHDLTLLLHFRDTGQSAEKRMALVMLGDLRTATNLRFGLAAAGGLVMPGIVWLTGFDGRGWAIASSIMLVVLLAAELVERYLFFRAAPASRMPGGIG
jgi:DMSO reductase anchor subunit